MTKQQRINELEQELLKAHQDIEKLVRIKSDFVSIISHELRTPLTSIKESVSLVLDGVTGPLNENQSEFLAIAKNNIGRLTRLITDILDFSKLESDRISMRKRKVNINELIKEAYSMAGTGAGKKKLSFDLELSDALEDVWLDPERLGQALNHLISNAIKFNRENGRIKIISSMENIDGRGAVKVVIEDTGIGIMENDIPNLFNHFSPLDTSMTRASNGVGLGLAISKQIIELHGGDIWVESKKDVGSNFIFTLPVYKEGEEFEFILEESIERSEQNDMNLALILFGIDSHKDSKKETLDRIEKIISSSVRGPEDKTVRFKKGEFVAVMAGTDRTGAMKIINRLRGKLETPVCFGLAIYPDESLDKDKLVKKAEKDLKTGKHFI
ncbi:MAG: hypothetical protein KKC66_04135 [Candidatus Omnitrophica bacterium]|nr:hypothetical protein [Candidatus Omnitrophota bacterium]MBU1933069.1 hypothetical protein [Candidatus Omnitrophota bacterium]